MQRKILDRFILSVAASALGMTNIVPVLAQVQLPNLIKQNPPERLSPKPIRSTDSEFIQDPDAPNGNSPSVVQERPINPLEAIAIRQDLSALIGRVENAITTAHVTKQISQPDSQTASQPMSQSAAIALARQLLKDMPGMIQAGRHNEVRAIWQQTRQGLWKDYPANVLTPISEVRAIWLDRGTIVAAGSERKLAEVFDRMAAAGVNTVFIETVNAGYPIYPSRVAPQQNPLIVGWDPLASSVKLAHERKMELHAWVWVFGVGNKRHNRLVNKPENYPGPVLAAYPDWANREQDGSIFAPEGKTFLDPANPAVQTYLISLYREILTRYKVDGLQLDYIRYPRQDGGFEFGFGTAGRQKFQALTGVDPVQIDPSNRSLWWMWTEFRTQQVNQFVARVSKELRQVKPDIVISAAVFPWRPLDRINRIQQNWETWIGRGDIDMLVPMTYSLDTNRFLQLGVQPVLAGIAQSPVLLLPGVLIRGIEGAELLDQLQAVRDLPSGGYSLFAAEHLRPSFTGALKTTKPSENDYILPQRKPFAAAQLRYTALKQEWQVLLKSNSIWVKGESLESWQKQVEDLDKSLDQLSRQPSQANYKMAIADLDTMLKKLPDWMRLENLERPYRVTTWSNRLEAIAAILRYGESRLRYSEAAQTAANANK